MTFSERFCLFHIHSLLAKSMQVCNPHIDPRHEWCAVGRIYTLFLFVYFWPYFCLVSLLTEFVCVQIILLGNGTFCVFIYIFKMSQTIIPMHLLVQKISCFDFFYYRKRRKIATVCIRSSPITCPNWWPCCRPSSSINATLPNDHVLENNFNFLDTVTR